MNVKFKKGFAVFGSFLIVFAIFNFLIIIGSDNVYAANVDTCGLTEDGNYCVEVSNGEGWDEYGGCVAGHSFTYSSRSEVDECGVGTCVPSGLGNCLANIEKVRCTIDESGIFHEDVSPSDVSDCQIGCCQQYSSSCSLQQEKTCLNDLGGEYLWSGDDVQNCNLECADALIGCYKKAGSCEYGNLDNFRGQSGFSVTNFYEDTFCSDVMGCPSYDQGQEYKSCGDGTTDGDSWSLYWYDSKGNREDLVDECSSPEGKCEDVDGKGGDSGFCRSTNCIENCVDCEPSKFRSGESVCVNVLDGYFDNSKRSIYLENYKISCQNGDIYPGFGGSNEGKDREKRCEESVEGDNENRIVAGFKDNEWEECAVCGDDGGGLAWNFLDLGGYVPVLGDAVLFLAGDYCNGLLQKDCSEFGDCEYDRDVWTPIGSCNPKYPPGINTDEQCKLCGTGGDAGANICTQNECNSLGDCYFERTREKSFYAAGGLVLGTYSSCMGIGLLTWLWPWGGASSAGAVWKGCNSALIGLGGKQLLLWGLVSAIYGGAALTGTHEEREYSLDEDIMDNGKMKLGYALVAAKSYMNSLASLDPSQLTEQYDLQESPQKSVGISMSPLFTFKYEPVVNQVSSSVLSYISPYVTGNKVKITAVSSSGFPWAQIGWSAGLLAEFIFLEESFKTGECHSETDVVSYYENSDNCENCGTAEGQWYCTEDRCNALGGINDWCVYVPYEEGGKLDGQCLPSTPEDLDPPYVTSIEIDFLNNENSSVSGPHNSNSKSLDVSSTFSWEISKADLVIETSEKARCSYSKNREQTFDGGNLLEWSDETMQEHKIEVPINTNDKLEERTYLYFKCKDFVPNSIDQYDDSNYVSFKFGDAPDEIPPTIDYISPIGSVSLPSSVEEIGIQLFAYDKNGVGDCRYSKPDYSQLADDLEEGDDAMELLNSYANYNDMESLGTSTSVQCVTLDETCAKFDYIFELTGDWGVDIGESIGENITSYSLHVLCADSEENVMYDPLLWTFNVWETFNISIDSPQEGDEIWDTSIQLEVSSERDAICDYRLSGAGISKEGNLSNGFISTFHTGIETNLTGSTTGEKYLLNVSCNDVAGNVVTDAVNFDIFSDEFPPELLRLWTSSNLLYLKFDEGVDCYYGEDSLDFEFGPEGEGSLMLGSGNGETQALNLNSETSYYGIICRDVWDNEASFTIYP